MTKFIAAHYWENVERAQAQYASARMVYNSWHSHGDFPKGQEPWASWLKITDKFDRITTCGGGQYWEGYHGSVGEKVLVWEKDFVFREQWSPAIIVNYDGPDRFWVLMLDGIVRLVGTDGSVKGAQGTPMHKAFTYSPSNPTDESRHYHKFFG